MEERCVDVVCWRCVRTTVVLYSDSAEEDVVWLFRRGSLPD